MFGTVCARERARERKRYRERVREREFTPRAVSSHVCVCKRERERVCV